MDTNQTLLLLAVIVAGILAYFFVFKGKPAKEEPVIQPAQAPNHGADKRQLGLQLQAYERMALLVDRITLSNLINRTPHQGLTAQEMQLSLARSIRDEFDYNITQQIYITPETWIAVKNLKERNLYIINQVASVMPPAATGLDLNRAILEYVMNDPQANQHELVSEALSYEAKRLLQ